MSKFLTIEKAVKEFKIKSEIIEEAIKKNKIPVVYSEGKFNKFSRKHFLKWYENQEFIKENPPVITGNLIIVTETKEIKQNKKVNVNDFALLKDLAKEYDLHGNCIRGAIRRKEIEYIEENGEFKINKKSFKEWLINKIMDMMMRLLQRLKIWHWKMDFIQIQFMLQLKMEI